MQYYSFLIFSLFITDFSYAQKRLTDDKYVPIESTDSIILDKSRPKVLSFLEFGVSANSYKGDLSDSYKKWSSSFQLSITFNKGRRINHRLLFSNGFLTAEKGVKSSQIDLTQANNYFSTEFFSLQYELQVNLLKRRFCWVGLTFGLGLIRYNVSNQDGRDLRTLQTTRNSSERDYPNTSLILPIGITAAYWLKNGYGVGTHIGLMNLQTDYIDNISQRGLDSGNDNALIWRFFVLIPLKKTQTTLLYPQDKKPESH